METVTRKVGDIWKDEFLPRGSKFGGQWKVQFPNGIMSFRTKKTALEISEAIPKDLKVPIS